MWPPTHWWADLALTWDALDQIRRESYRSHRSDDEALLLSLIPERERERYQATQEFFAVGSAGGLYLIRYGITGNVHRMPGGLRLCAHPPLYRDADTEASMVAQYLTIRTDEPGFLAVANRM